MIIRLELYLDGVVENYADEIRIKNKIINAIEKHDKNIKINKIYIK